MKLKPQTWRSFRQQWLRRLGLSGPLAGFEMKWRMRLMTQWLQPLRTLLVIPGSLFALLGVMLLFAAASSGCAPRLIATEVNVPAELRGRCTRADLPSEREIPLSTAEREEIDAYLLGLLRDTQGFSLRQEEAINVCEAKSMAKDAIIDAHNQAVRKATCPWWKLGLCR